MNEQPPISWLQDRPSDDDRQRMLRFGVTTERRSVYRYEGYVYERLEDALAYATIEAARRGERQ